MYGLFVDFATAFDSISRTKLLRKLKNEFEIDDNHLKLIAHILKNLKYGISGASY